MRALVWREIEKVVMEADWPDPHVSGREVLVRVQAEGICMTDIHMMRGKLNFAQPPWILGHELAGVVEKVGTEVKGWHAGDRVIVDPVVTCGCCRFCQSGKKYLCPDGGELGTTYGQGGYGEFIVAPAENLYHLPDELSFVEGAMMEPLNCTLGAIDRVRGMTGSHVVVFGPGPAGLLFLQLAKAYGAISVTLIGMHDDRLQLGHKLGADRIIDISKASLEEELLDVEFDVAIEASGSERAVADAFRYVTKGGTVVLYGLNGSDQPTICSDVIVSKDLAVVTCISAPLLWEKGVRLVQSGRINVKEIVSHQIAFEQAESMVNGIAGGMQTVIKAVICHEVAE